MCACASIILCAALLVLLHDILTSNNEHISLIHCTHTHTHTHTHTSTHAPAGQRPNGSDDTASGTRGWNCLGTSEGVGDLGPTCNLDRRAFGEYECYDSCGTSCKRDDAGNALNCVAASCWCETPKFEAHPQPKFEAHFQPSRGKLSTLLFHEHVLIFCRTSVTIKWISPHHTCAFDAATYTMGFLFLYFS